jgi:hypothetical protein
MDTTFDRRISTQLKTWLTAVGINFQDTTSGLFVTNKSGESVPVDLGGARRPHSISIKGRDLTSRSLDKSLKAFQALQLALGYEPKAPVDRGPIPTQKAHYARDFELVAMRHSEFRRVPNPDGSDLAAFKVVCGKAVWKFFKHNTQICADHGYDVGDLLTYAYVWTVNYIGLYDRPEQVFEERERFLCHYLGQRFDELRKQLNKKKRNTLPMLDDAFIAQHGRPFEYTNKSNWFATGDEDQDSPEEAWIAEEEKGESPRERSYVKRTADRKAASAILDERLRGMGHDEMVALLSSAIENDRIHLDARREATRRLRAHATVCKVCAKAELPTTPGVTAISNQPIEDENGNVYPNVKAAAKALKLFPSNVRAVLAGRYAHTGHHTFKYVSAAEVDEDAGPVDGAGAEE